ncbi:MAG: FecR domain-containing protein [Alphaproteobacteria bacterium]|nr:FecR domain-containing protein [Alphaproteobacteria bacterium]
MTHPSPGAPYVKEAAVWLARLRADDRSLEDERAFRSWLMADPRHAAAFEAVNGMWDSVGALSRDMRNGEVPLEPRFSRRALLSGGVGLAVVAGGTFALVQSAAAEVYQTDVGEQKHVTLKDGTGVFLDTDTKLVVDFDAKDRKVDLRYGRANFRVAPDASRPFAVEAAQKLVIGTRSTFDVRRYGDDISVLLIHGQATVKNTNVDAGRQLRDGERLSFISGQSPRLDKPNLLPLIAWHTGQAIFENSLLTDVVLEMNRYSTIKLEVDDSRIARMKVSGVYRVGDNTNFARSLARLLPVEIRVVDDRIQLVGDDARMLQG